MNITECIWEIKIRKFILRVKKEIKKLLKERREEGRKRIGLEIVSEKVCVCVLKLIC